MLFRGIMVTGLSGSIDGLVASHNRGGPYFKSRVVPVDPHTTAQEVMRDGMTWVHDQWVAMSQEDRIHWEAYARRHPLTNRVGASHTISGYGYWTRWALPRYQATHGPLAGGVVGTATPPHDETYPIGNVTVAWQTTNSVIRFGWEYDGWTVDDHNYFMVHLATPRAATINWFRGPYSLQGGVGGDPDDGPFSFWDFTVPTDFRPATGQRLFYRLRLSHEKHDLNPEITGFLTGP